MSREKRTIIVILMGVLLGLSVMGSAAPMGTALTYQGRLTDAGSPANARYDFKFRLYDASTGGGQVGLQIQKSGVPVNDGYFKVELDFTNVFRGDATWLEIEVAPEGDPVYTPLSPRQELTPTPYAIYAARAGSVAGGIGIDGSGTANYIPKFQDHNTLENSVISQDGSNIGIGATPPTSARLFVDGDIMLDYGDAYRISMYSGLGWNSSTGSITLGASNPSVGLELYSGSTDPRMIIDENTGNVGIANPTPDAKLHVVSSSIFDVAVLGENGGNNGYLGHGSVGVKGNSVDGIGVRGFSENDWAILGVSPNGSGQAGVVGAIITDNGGMLWRHNSGVSGGTQDGYGVSGRSISGIGVSGSQSDSGNFGHLGTTTAGVYGEASDPGSSGVHGVGNSGAKAGRFEGEILVDGDIKKTYGSSEYNAVPIAYGSISTAGTINSGTGNFTVTWSGSSYNIAINGETYHYANYTTIVTPVSSSTSPVIAQTTSAIGQLRIYLINLAGATVQKNFHFVTYKQ